MRHHFSNRRHLLKLPTVAYTALRAWSSIIFKLCREQGGLGQGVISHQHTHVLIRSLLHIDLGLFIVGEAKSTDTLVCVQANRFFTRFHHHLLLSRARYQDVSCRHQLVLLLSVGVLEIVIVIFSVDLLEHGKDLFVVHVGADFLWIKDSFRVHGRPLS